MLILDPDLEQLLNKGALSPVFLVTVSFRGSLSEADLMFCTGDRPLRNVPSPPDNLRVQSFIPNIVASIDTFGQELDAMTRVVSFGDTEITFVDDGQVRGVLDWAGAAQADTGDSSLNRHLFGSKISISLGGQGLDISKFQSIGNFIVSEVTPSEGYVSLSCVSLTNITSTFTVSRNYKARDPYCQLDQLMKHTAALSDTILDRDSYDPDYGYIASTPPSVDFGKRHYVIRQDDNTAGNEEYFKTDKQPKGVSAWNLINGITYLTRGMVAQHENGKIAYTPWEPNKAVAKHLTTDDVDTFMQSVMYSNTVNKVTHAIKSTAGRTSFDPWSSMGLSNSTVTVGGVTRNVYRQTSAYFGGIDVDTEYTTEDAASAQDLRYPGTGNATYPQSTKYWNSISEGLDWCSGMSSCTFLYAPTICSSGDPGMVTGGGSIFPLNEGPTYGKAKYTHAHNFGSLPFPDGVVGVMGKLEIPGYLNCTYEGRPDYIHSTPLGGGTVDWPNNSGFAESIFTPLQSPVIRVTPSSADAASAGAEGVVLKEGLITRIDNRGAGGSVLYIDWNNDSTTEFVADWGHTNRYDWIILEPQFPIFPDLSRYRISGTKEEAMGRINRPHGGKSNGLAGGNTAGEHVYDYQRYFYIHHASLSGFCGLGIRPLDLNPQATVINPGPDPHPAPNVNTKVVKSRYRGPKGGLVSGTPWEDGKLLWGHCHDHDPGILGQETVSQLKPQERVTREGSGESKFSYILLEYNENNNTPGATATREVVKFNQAYFARDYGFDAAYPRPDGHPRLSGALGWVHQYATESSEPPSRYDGTEFIQQSIASCCVLRADCQSVSVSAGNIAKPSGRDVESTHAQGNFNIPANLKSFVQRYAIRPAGAVTVAVYDAQGDIIEVDAQLRADAKAPNWYWAGLKATDVTIARDVNQQMLDRFSYGAPVVEVVVGLKHIDIQLGDFVSLDNDVYLRHSKSKSNSSTVFEVTRKEISLEADSPRITFELCWVRQGASGAVAGGYVMPEVHVLIKLKTGEDVFDNDGTIVYDGAGGKLKGITRMPAGGGLAPPIVEPPGGE